MASNKGWAAKTPEIEAVMRGAPMSQSTLIHAYRIELDKGIEYLNKVLAI